ncbi:MAG: RluA family pseudouridine synthase [Oscillospiraceae bacterium]|nr:RluA family pseudouridine synthase [Oscillospiraceae bacterium]
MREFIINKNDSGQRLDKFLQKAVPKLPKSLLYKYIRLKRIKLNGKRCQNADFLKENDVLALYINDEFFENEQVTVAEESELMKIKTEPVIVYEDDNIIIAYKPVGMDVHRGSEKNKETLIDIIKAYLFRKGDYSPSEESSFSPAVCNRLDRNTTGLVIAAKNAAALREINESIRERLISKTYLCVCVGTLKSKHAVCEAYHRKGQHNLVNIRKDKAEGYKKIITEYTVLEEKGGLSLCEINLITGRTHQIRAHLAFLGAPVLGDGKYGNVAVNKRKTVFHQQLCAYSLGFTAKKGSLLEYLDGKRFVSPLTGFVCENFKIKNTQTAIDLE